MKVSYSDKVGNKVFGVVYTSKEELLEWFFQLYKTKLPKAQIIKKHDHLVVMLSGEIIHVKPNGVKYVVY